MKVARHEIKMLASIKSMAQDSIDEIEFQKNIDSWEYEHMLDKIKGDGAAQVSVTAEFSDKTYGQGISLKIQLTITCNQRLEDIETAYQFANQIAQDQLEENIPEVRKIYDAHFTSKG